MPRKRRAPTLPLLLALPPELRIQIYNILLDDIIASNSRVFWIPDVLVRDVNKYPTMAVSRHKGQGRAPTPKGPFAFFGMHREFPVIHHRDLSPLILLAQTCKSPFQEVWPLAWDHADFAVQGGYTLIRALLGPCLVFSMPPRIAASIKALRLILMGSRTSMSIYEMREIIDLIKSHLLNLKTLELASTIHVGLQYSIMGTLLRLTIGAASAQMLGAFTSLPRNVSIIFDVLPSALVADVTRYTGKAKLDEEKQTRNKKCRELMAKCHGKMDLRKAKKDVAEAEHVQYLRHAACNHPEAEKCIGCQIF